MKKAGLEVMGVDVPEDPLMPLNKYLDIDGPLKKVFRDGDSTWSLAQKDELEAGLDWWKNDMNEIEKQAFIEEREIQRKRVG